MHIHILGICGTFMGGIAAIAKEAGHTVSGCDTHVYPPMSDQLRILGIDLIEGFLPEQLSLKPDLWVIGNVVSRGNPLMEAILDAGLPYISGPQWLAEQVLKDKWVLAVAGTHGKTTTASMLTWVLEANGYNPGFLIGGVPGNFGVSARLGGQFFVIEADEYDTAFFDKRSKFVHYRPRTAVLNNLEFDHADIFADLAAIETQFHHLVRTVPGKGRVVFNGAEPSLGRVLHRGLWSEKESFGSNHADVTYDWTLTDVMETPTSSEFTVNYQQAGAKVVTCQLAMAGLHNRLNAVAAMAAARHVGLSPDLAAAALRTFEGVKRRLEVRGVANGVTVIDDFAHHPTAIQTTVAGLRARLQKQGASKIPGRILAVLEPRSNTMKLGSMKTLLAASLNDADLVYCYRGSLGWDTQEALAPLGDKAHSFDDLPTLVAAVLKDARPGDQVLVMSNGGFGGVHQRLLDGLQTKGS
jgi:UDP-N-acetylmuramate: L-alanyl-gamma-D-glutamyl-meso-diaminopimelate ligase